jgi:hypothetical protein
MADGRNEIRSSSAESRPKTIIEIIVGLMGSSLVGIFTVLVIYPVVGFLLSIIAGLGLVVAWVFLYEWALEGEDG